MLHRSMTTFLNVYGSSWSARFVEQSPVLHQRSDPALARVQGVNWLSRR
jgi:hypothetical protein